MSNIPIIFVNIGYNPYMEFTLRQAKAACPDAKIILLGDINNNVFHFVINNKKVVINSPKI